MLSELTRLRQLCCDPALVYENYEGGSAKLDLCIQQYTNADFKIETYVSNIDKDNDGIDDQTDILNNVRNYISKNPKYKSKYYETGYPNDEYGVCTDVVAFGLKDANMFL